MKIKQIIIVGDVVKDINIYKGQRNSPTDKGEGTLIQEKKGGSHFLFEIISETVKPDNNRVKEEQKGDIQNCIFGLEEEIFKAENFPSSLTTFATWSKSKCTVPTEYQKIAGKEIETWKVLEPLGFGGKVDNAGTGLPDNFYGSHKLTNDLAPSLLVFDDCGNHFRNDEQAWNDLLYKQVADTNERGKRDIDWVILKTAYPLGHGRLMNELSSNFSDKLVVITSIDEIRKEDVLISKGISWEQTALDLIYELKNNNAINKLLKCRHLIVNFQSEGALYVEMKEEEIWKCRLIFDPEHFEGQWSKAVKIAGSVIGSMDCFTASMVYGLLENSFNIETTITRALSAMRRYKITGHGSDSTHPGFPFGTIISEIVSPTSQFASAFVPIPGMMKNSGEFLNQKWTILEGNYKPSPDKSPEPLFDTAFRFALYGNKELANTPFLKINNLTTYDRCEIEALHNVKNLIFDYLEEDKPEKPLSLAVFGMPGSGKSFAVKQLAKSLDLPILEFNLSQFADGDLEGAFHLVRDKVLEGKTPVVFWDEFDSQAYKWLQYLLAPMQDGKFQAGQIIHPIGKSIFIFAGGTSYTFETFGIEKPQSPEPNDLIAIKEYELQLGRYNDFTLKKGPDFKSRLSGYLNIQGPNQLEMLDEFGKIMKDKDGNTAYNESDIQYPVRRALFIRGICRLKDGEPLNIDYGLLHALIKTRKYAHGSRSLEKLLNYLKTKNSSKLQRSNLPTFSILNMLVDKDFIGLLDEDKFFEFQAFKIAPQIHQNWMKIGDMQGWKLEYHKDFNYLPSHMKDENIAAARRIQKILDALKPELHLNIVPINDAEFRKEADFQKVINDPDLMEKMAIEEHKGWVETKVLTDWKFDKNRNDDKKLHNCMIGWDEEKKLEGGTTILLSEDDRNKDKDAIEHFAEVLKKAGFVIVEEKS